MFLTCALKVVSSVRVYCEEERKKECFGISYGDGADTANDLFTLYVYVLPSHRDDDAIFINSKR